MKEYEVCTARKPNKRRQLYEGVRVRVGVGGEDQATQ